MNCTELKKYLDDYLDEEMPLSEQEMVEAHIKHCAACQKVFDEYKTIRQALGSMPVEEPSANFEARVFEVVRSQNGEGNKYPGNRFVAGFTTAVIASLTIWFASTVYISRFEDKAPQMINLALNQSRTVKLVFDAPTDLAEVTLSVELPENVELEGYAGQKELVWQTSLDKGLNILALPILATGNGQGELVAQLTYGEKTKQFYIVLKTDAGGVYLHQINNIKSV